MPGGSALRGVFWEIFFFSDIFFLRIAQRSRTLCGGGVGKECVLWRGSRGGFQFSRTQFLVSQMCIFIL